MASTRGVGFPLASNSQDLTQVDGPSTIATANGIGQQNTVGQHLWDDAGNEYIYCVGVASLAAGDFVIFDSLTFTLARLVTAAAAGGPVGVAMAAAVASTWGWVQIYGTNALANIATATIATASPLYSSATGGRATTTAAAATVIYGAMLAVANPAANVGTAFLSHPFTMQTSTL